MADTKSAWEVLENSTKELSGEISLLMNLNESMESYLDDIIGEIIPNTVHKQLKCYLDLYKDHASVMRRILEGEKNGQKAED